MGFPKMAPSCESGVAASANGTTAVAVGGEVGETDFGPSPVAGACLDVVVKELPMDLNCTFYLHSGEPVNPHARRPYTGHGAHTVGGGVVCWPPRAQHKVPLPLTQTG